MNQLGIVLVRYSRELPPFPVPLSCSIVPSKYLMHQLLLLGACHESTELTIENLLICSTVCELDFKLMSNSCCTHQD